MTVASEITRIKTNIANAYNSASEKGATLPDIQNSENLAACISSITDGGSDETSNNYIIIDNNEVIALPTFTVSDLQNVSGYTVLDLSRADITTFETRFSDLAGDLEKITFPDKLTAIPSACFAYMDGVRSVNLGNCTSLTSIEASAFAYCSGLKTLILPNSIQSLGGSIIKYTNLETIMIPNSINTIDERAFSMSSLKRIIIDKPQDSITGAPWEAEGVTVVWTGG